MHATKQNRGSEQNSNNTFKGEKNQNPELATAHYIKSLDFTATAKLQTIGIRKVWLMCGEKNSQKISLMLDLVRTSIQPL